MKSVWLVFSLTLLAGAFVAAQDSEKTTAEDGPLPPGPHVNLVYAKCQSCHSLSKVVDSQGLPPFLWEDTVNLMIQLGMQVSDEEKANLTEYLSTYMGPDGPPDTAESGEAMQDTSASDEAAQPLDGAALYASNCSSCHQAGGQGVQGAFPPLTEHAPKLYEAEGGRDYLAQLMLYGLQGEIQVQGETYNGVMPAWAQLSDGELAALLNHILTAWDNDTLLGEGFTAYTAEDIAAQRGQDVSSSDMLGRRPSLGASE